MRTFEELLHAVEHYNSMRTVVCVICKLLHVFQSHKIDFCEEQTELEVITHW